MENKLELLLNKLEEKKDKYIYHDEYLGMGFELKKLSLRRFNQLQEGADKNGDKTLEAMYKVIYEHVPLFQAPELIEKLGVQKKESVVPGIYNNNLEPMNKLMKFINRDLYQIIEDGDAEKK